MINLFRQTKLWSVVQGIETKSDVHDPTLEAWVEKDLGTQLEIMSHPNDQQADIIKNSKHEHKMWMDLQYEFE